MQRKTIRQSVTLKPQDKEFLKEISKTSKTHKNTVSKGIEILCDIFRAINKKNKII